jgi:hypothetical protein
MAVTTAVLGSLLVDTVHVNTDVASTVVYATTSSCTLYQVDIDNSSNTAAVYLKIYDGTGVSVGTTSPHYILKCPGSQRISYTIPEGQPLSTALGYVCVLSNGVGGETGPTSNVTVRFLFDD